MRRYAGSASEDLCVPERREAETQDVRDAAAWRAALAASSIAVHSCRWSLRGLGGGALGFYGYAALRARRDRWPQDKVFEVERGMRTPDIAAALEEGGRHLRRQRLSAAAAYARGNRERLKAGEYQFPAGMPACAR